MLLSVPPRLDELLKTLTTSNTIVQTVLTTVITVLLPYSIGFVLSEVGNIITYTIHLIFGDPTEWLTDYSCEDFKGRRIPQRIVNRAAYYAHQLFDINEEKFKETPRYYLFLIRAYVVNKTGGASDLSTRALDLANFAESIVIPLPLLFSLASFYVLPYLSQALFGASSLEFSYRLRVSILIFFVVFVLAVKRYLSLKENWVKHTYRGFVALAASDMYERGKKAGNS